MWAQIIKTRVKAGQEAAVKQLPQELEQQLLGAESGRGPSRVIFMEDQNNPGTFISVIFFDSESKAREYEGSPEQSKIQTRLMEVWDGPPEFTDLNVLHEINR